MKKYAIMYAEGTKSEEEDDDFEFFWIRPYLNKHEKRTESDRKTVLEHPQRKH